MIMLIRSIGALDVAIASLQVTMPASIALHTKGLDLILTPLVADYGL